MAVQKLGRGPAAAVADALAASWSLRRGHVAVVVALLVLALLGAGLMVLRDRPTRERVTPPADRAAVVSSGTPSPPPGTASPEPTLVIHVAGKVRRPGVIRLPQGSRVIDAVTASGGAASGVDLAGLNLARPLTDGEQVLVGVTPPPGSATTIGPAGAGAGPSGGIVDLNSASAEQLEELPGVGPVLAQRILEFRTSNGRFTSVDELREVTGIGERTFADLQDRVIVS